MVGSRSLTASSEIFARCVRRNWVSGPKLSASTRCRRAASKASANPQVRGQAGMPFDAELPGSRAIAGLTASMRSTGPVARSQTTPIRVSPGRISRSNSTRLEISSGATGDTPVTFPPGRARLATNPDPTGSPEWTPITMGIVRVACMAARIRCAQATMRSTSRATSSCAASCRRSARPPPLRYCSVTFWPTTQPRSRRPRKNPSRRQAPRDRCDSSSARLSGRPFPRIALERRVERRARPASARR